MAQGVPTYGPHDGEMTVRAFIDCSLSRVYHDEQDELDMLALLAPAYAKAKIRDVDGLQDCTLKQHDAVLSTVIEPSEVKGLRNQVLRFLGAKGSRHVPPADSPAAPLCTCARIKSPVERLALALAWLAG
jgi:hypothetical protein